MKVQFGLLAVVAMSLPANAFPFYTTPESFQAYVNQMWKSGGSGLTAFDFDVNDPSHTRRKYFNFHSCNYSQPQNRVNGQLWEEFSCKGYLSHISPIHSFQCKISATYEAYNNQYLGGNKRLVVGEQGDFKMCND